MAGRALKFSEMLVPGDCASFDFFQASGRYDLTAWTNRPDISTPENMEAFARNIEQHALIPIAMAKKDGRARKMTDVIRQQDFERSDLYNEFYRVHKTNRQVGLVMPVTDDLIVSFAVTTGGKDFTERDKAIMTLAAPHLLNALQNSLAYARIENALTAGNSGVAVLDSDMKIKFTAGGVGQMLERYFSGHAKLNGLPNPIVEWLNNMAESISDSARVPGPLLVEAECGTLRIRLMENSLARETTLLVEERSFSPYPLIERFGLTDRESQVLFWLGRGKSNNEIAGICCISVRTVHKHIENVFQKLGVETRTGAALRAIEFF